MDLLVDNNEELISNIKSTINVLKAKNMLEYLGVNIPGMLSSILERTLDKFDTKFEKNWKLNGFLYLENSDDDAVYERFELMEKGFDKVGKLGELNNEEFLNALKENINNQIEMRLNSDKEFGLDENQKKEILEDAYEKIDDLVDNFATKYFNDKVRDKLERYQDRWDKAIEKGNYDLADSIAKQIRKIFSTGFYKDDELRVRCEKTMHMDDLLDFKRENGENVVLTDLEKTIVNEGVDEEEREQLMSCI